jgi:hypothetical protein
MWFKNPVSGEDWMKEITGPLSPWEKESLELDVALRERLLGLTLLDGVPLSYLVPDPRLLPPESVRFFFLEPNWIERLLEGALAAANVGTMDDRTAAALMAKVHADEELRQRFTRPISGILLRSSLVSRYPGMQVRACGEDKGKEPPEDALELPLRRRKIGDSILLVLFSGTIQWVSLEEPAEGTHFAIEPGDRGWTQEVVPLEGGVLKPGKDSIGEVNVSFRAGSPNGVLDLGALEEKIKQKLQTPDEDTTLKAPVTYRDLDSRHIAATLQNRPFRMVFRANGPLTITIRPPEVSIATPR